MPTQQAAELERQAELLDQHQTVYRALRTMVHLLWSELEELLRVLEQLSGVDPRHACAVALDAARRELAMNRLLDSTDPFPGDTESYIDYIERRIKDANSYSGTIEAYIGWLREQRQQAYRELSL